jgi:hypothetical protein
VINVGREARGLRGAFSGSDVLLLNRDLGKTEICLEVASGHRR